MSTQVQLRRGTSSQCDAMTPAEGEIVVDMTNDRLRIGNGLDAGGIELPNNFDIQKQSFTYAIAGGTANALTLSVPNISEYSDGLGLEFKAVDDNTSSVTVDVSSLGVKNINKISSGSLVSLESGDIASGGIYRIVYNGTSFQLIGADQSESITAGDGLTQAGSIISMNTNNALGVGSHVMAQLIGGASVASGNTVAGTSLRSVYLRTVMAGGTLSVIQGSTLTGTWRNVSGSPLSAASYDIGLFMRIA